MNNVFDENLPSENENMTSQQYDNMPSQYDWKSLNEDRSGARTEGKPPERRKFYISYAIIAVNVLVWLFTEYYSKKYSVNANLIFGAKFNPLIMSGEYWRLITPIFLHGDVLHILFNSYSIYAIGPTVETLFGGLKFLVIYFIAGVMGNIASFAFSTHMSVGASGAIFGLLGALVYLIKKNKRIFKSSFGSGVVITIVYNLIYGFLNARIDNFAHIGGLVGGYIAAVALGLVNERKPAASRWAAFALVFAMAFTGMYAGFNSRKNLELKSYYEEEVAPLQMIDKALNSFKKKDYAKAEEISRKVLEIDGVNKDIKATAFDILAASLINEGKASEAIEYGRALVELNPPRGHYLLGLSYLNLNDPESAKKELMETVKLDSNNEHAAELLKKLQKKD